MFGPDWEEIPPAVTAAKWTEAFSKKELDHFSNLLKKKEKASS
jgi:hypothetical protein